MAVFQVLLLLPVQLISIVESGFVELRLRKQDKGLLPYGLLLLLQVYFVSVMLPAVGHWLGEGSGIVLRGTSRSALPGAFFLLLLRFL